MVGVRLWPGAEAHVDAMMWQGLGLHNTLGVEGFPNGEAYRIGTKIPNGTFARLFIRQTIGFGGEQEDVPDDQRTLAGKQDISRLTFTLGRMAAPDIFDSNAYANDPRTQFMNWAFVNNEALAVCKLGARWPIFTCLGTVTEFERRYSVNAHPGVIRFLAYLNKADMGSYQEAVDNPTRPADITATRKYRFTYGFGLNLEQQIVKNIGFFSRLGSNNGQNQAWTFSDVVYAASLGFSINGAFWHRPDDTVGLAGAFNGISKVEQKFFAAGGSGILGGDGNLNYGWEKILETYYNFQIWKTIHATVDYQFITDPAFNRDRGPVSVFGARLHWEL